MSRQPKIRWTEATNKELATRVRVFNSKITRLLKSGQYKENELPERVSVAQMREMINTRQDFNREMKSLKRFSRKGAEELTSLPVLENDNIKITKWQKREMSIRQGIVTRRRKERSKIYDDLEATSGGQGLGYTVGERQKFVGMGSAEEAELRPARAFTKSMTYSDLHRKAKALMKESQSNYFTDRDYMLRDNFIKAIEENYPYEMVQDLVKDLKAMSIEDFLEAYRREGANFEAAYPQKATVDTSDESTNEYLEHISAGYLKRPLKVKTDDKYASFEEYDKYVKSGVDKLRKMTNKEKGE